MKTKNSLISLAIACLLFVGSAQAQLIIYEPASSAVARGTSNYAIDAINPDPDGGLGVNLGFPATNSITPANVSTGLRSNNTSGEGAGYGTGVKVVAGLSYSNNNYSLTTTGNALQQTTTGINLTSKMYAYKEVAPSADTDPFYAERSTISKSLFGWHGSESSLYFSMLVKVSELNDTQTENSIAILTRQNNANDKAHYIGQTNSNWTMTVAGGTANQNIKAATANATTLIVFKITFKTASTIDINFWVDPLLGVSLGAADKTISDIAGVSEFLGLQFNSLGTLIFDEFRMGKTEVDVMPTVASVVIIPPTALTTSNLSTTSLTLNWTASVTPGVTYEIFKDGNSIGTTGLGITTYNVNELTLNTPYTFSVKALKDGVYSNYNPEVSVRTTNPGASELMIYEGANYNLNATNSDPDGGLNSSLGYPATNSITPANVSTGLRSSGTSGEFAGWGTGVSVVEGLTYSNNNYTLNTSGNALRQTTTGTTSTSTIYAYKETPGFESAATDPFFAERATSNKALFGWHGSESSLYFSMLVKVSTLNDTQTENSIMILTRQNNGNQVSHNIGQTNSNWTMTVAGGAANQNIKAATADTNTLLVGKITFKTASTIDINLWVNPLLNTSLGAADLTISDIAGVSEFLGLQFNSLGTLTFDEFRMGKTAADILPVSISTSLNTVEKLDAQVFVNAANQIVITAPEKSNYAIYNAAGQKVNEGTTSLNQTTANFKPQAGMYIVRLVGNEKELTTRVLVK